MTPRFLCEHSTGEKQVGYRALCATCHSFRDEGSPKQEEFQYDDTYPQRRHHLDGKVGALKVKSLRRWLSQVNVKIRRQAFCEVGFGGGHTLQFLQEQGAAAFGIEVVEADFASAQALGVLTERVFHFNRLPTELPRPIDVWMFLDSFEHLIEPALFMQWVITNSTPRAEVLIVLPRADSVSNRLMGRSWVHRTPDHGFHWSRAGLLDFFAKRGFHLQRQFYPLKYISPSMILAHLQHKLRLHDPTSPAAGKIELAVPVPFNFGELGLLLRRVDSPRTG